MHSKVRPLAPRCGHRLVGLWKRVANSRVRPAWTQQRRVLLLGRPLLRRALKALPKKLSKGRRHYQLH